MDETNKTLALLLVAAIIVSLGGTIISLNKLGEMELAGITGFASTNDTGTVTLSVTDSTQIAFTTTTLDFGTGFVNGTANCNNCTMWTNSSIGGENYSDPCCAGTSWPSLGLESGLWIENQGNTNLSVQLNFTEDASEFIGGDTVTPLVQFKLFTDNDADACAGSTCSGEAANDNTDSCPTGPLLYTDQWYDFNKSNPYICGASGVYDLKPVWTEDEIVMDIKVLIPQNALPGAKSVDIVVTGTSAT